MKLKPPTDHDSEALQQEKHGGKPPHEHHDACSGRKKSAAYHLFVTALLFEGGRKLDRQDRKHARHGVEDHPAKKRNQRDPGELVNAGAKHIEAERRRELRLDPFGGHGEGAASTIGNGDDRRPEALLVK